MSHLVNDRVSLELARRVAGELARRPEWVEVARGNLARWRELNANAPRLLRCGEEWEGILDRPVAEVVAILTAETDEGQRLRQNSPFTGCLSAAEVWEIKRRIRDDANRA